MADQFLITAPFRGAIVAAADPLLGPGQVLCRSLCVGLCGTDRLVFSGEMPAASFPRVPGHEVVAVVIEDRSARELAPGATVCIDPYKNCGTCHACRAGRPNCCRSNQTLGVQRDGILRETFAADADRVHVVPGDDDVRRFVLAEPLSLALHVVERAGPVRDRWCLVAGVGNVGSMVVRVLKEQGARIIAWSLPERSLATAAQLGAELCVNPTQPDAEQQVMDATQGEGVSVAFECAGKSQAVEMCVRLAAFAGRVVLVGHSKEVAGIKGSDIVFKELDIRGSRNSLGCFPRAIAWLARDREMWNVVISHRFRWPEADAAFQLTAGGDNPYSKIVIDFPD